MPPGETTMFAGGEIAMNERRIEGLVQFAGRVANRRKDAQRQFIRRTALPHIVLQRLAFDVFEQHNKRRISHVAFENARHMDKAFTFVLRTEYLFVGASLARIGRDGLADERSEFRTIIAHIEYALGAFVGCVAQHCIDAVIIAST